MRKDTVHSHNQRAPCTKVNPPIYPVSLHDPHNHATGSRVLRRQPAATQAPAAELGNTLWKMTTVNGANAIPDTNVIVYFDRKAIWSLYRL